MKIMRPKVDGAGWTEWIHPVRNKFRMVCCDCGLSHDMEFRLVEKRRIIFRARRNYRSTAAMRRNRD